MRSIFNNKFSLFVYKIGLKIGIFTIMFGIIYGVYVNAEEREDIYDKIRKSLSSINTLQADILQEKFFPEIDRSIKSSGRFYLFKDRFVHIVYEKPFRQIIRIENNEILIYQEEDREAVFIPMSHNNDNTWKLFWPSNWISKDVSIKKGVSFYVIIFPPNRKFKKLKLFLSKNLLPKRFLFVPFKERGKTNIIFSNSIVNRPIPKEILNFSLPSDVKRKIFMPGEEK